jgi:predicted esterase
MRFFSTPLRPDVRLAVAGLLLWLSTAQAQTTPAAPEGRFVDRVYRDADGEHKYVVFEPVGYTPDKKWPLVFYLHGASGRGRDGRAQLVVGLGPAVKTRAATLPFLVVFPQNENLRSRLLGGWTDGSNELDRAIKILDEVEQNYSVNRQHEVLVGVSMGAFGAWSTAAKSPDRWKAVIPISGGGEPGFVPALAKVPVWAFHAADDQLVPPSRSTDLVKDINAAGGRAFVSIVPTGGHNIGAAVLARDEIFAWLEHPERDPVTSIDWSQRAVTADMTNQIPYVPGADVAAAARVRINRDLLTSLSYLFADQVPTDALQGWKPGRHEQQGIGRSTTVGGTYYQGHIERALLTPLDSGHLRLQVGIRNMNMTITEAHVQAPLVNAQSGPITISIGAYEPVWMTMDIQPVVEQRRIKLQLASVQFEVPPHNWSISRPDVNVRGIPFMEDRIADRLVEGVDSKKAEIEQSIRDRVPQMLTQMETKLNEAWDRTVTYRQWPMPLWQPRFRFYPESVKVDSRGLEIHLGATVAALAPKSSTLPLRPFPANGEQPPEAVSTGLDIAMSARLVHAYATLLSASDVARFHVLDMNSAGFRKLGTHEFWNSVLPPDQQLDPSTELNTEFVVVKPIQLQPRGAAPGQQGLGHQISLTIPQLQLQLASRPAGEKAWTDRAVVDIGFRQDMRLTVDKPTYSQRKMKMGLDPIQQPTVEARWLTAGDPVQIDRDLIAKTFQEGWSSSFGATQRGGQIRDMAMGQLVLRCDEAGGTDTHYVLRLQRPGIRVYNPGKSSVDYQVRATVSDWSKTLTLAPGMYQEFTPSTPLLWRTPEHTGDAQFTLPLGFEAEIRKDAKSGALTLFKWNDDVR